ncbi:serine/threonine protein kinase [Cystobacter fuscus]|uniref:protein kinase domain-containing protein n=1 Tax=Cystobacter fuscus TaxID=43 RepID=UPI002B2E3464|nr:serine/threonine protein kinase [Cystobacter fuscus]
MSHRDEAMPPPAPHGEEKTDTEPVLDSTGIPAGEQAPRASLPARPPPRQVGRFLLLKQLGQGGMGVVYAAYDPDLDRKVALKLWLVKDEGTDLEEGRARLVREAQAMARVSHPHVIPVFEVGSWEDQVFVAMELVEGGTLREWLRERPRSWREVLEKYVAAGKGLAAAHAAGLVHRDFKPANVLVGHNGRVYVTDFGLAQRDARFTPSRGLTQEALPLPRPVSVLRRSLTQEGMVHGTPHYMSPEQTRGDVLDARSDQFSFCAALYLALYNTRPFDPEEMAQAAARRGASPSVIQEPPRGVKVPVWVRRAVMRGLSLDPSARFASMDALLGALSQERRLTRWRWLGMGALLGLALVAVGGAAVWRSRLCTGAERQMAEVWGAPERQRVEAAFQKAGGPAAGQMFRRASAVLDAYAVAWSRQSTEACEATRPRDERMELLLSEQVVCLELRRESLRALVKVLGEVDARGVEKSLDAVYALPAPSDCANVGTLSEQQPRPVDPSRRADLERLETRVAELKALLDVSRYPAALEEAEALAPRVVASGHLPLLAEMRLHQGWLLALMGRTQEGASLLEQAVYDAAAGRADRLQVSILNKLLFVTGQLEHYADAERWGRLGEAMVRRLGGDTLLESDLLMSRAHLALWQEKPQQARVLLERSLALLGGLPPGHPKRARVTYTLGRALLALGETRQAVEMLEEALRQMESAVGPRHLELAWFHGELSRALRENAESARALEHARFAADLYRSSAVDPLALADALDSQGMCLLALERNEDALRVFREALGLKLQQLSPEDSELQSSYDGVGQALLALGHTREAIAILRRAGTFVGVPDKVLGDTGFALAQALWRDGRVKEARVEAARALERFTRAGSSQRAAEVKSWMGMLAR